MQICRVTGAVDIKYAHSISAVEHRLFIIVESLLTINYLRRPINYIIHQYYNSTSNTYNKNFSYRYVKTLLCTAHNQNLERVPSNFLHPRHVIYLLNRARKTLVRISHVRARAQLKSQTRVKRATPRIP